jgi:hypothetical protein
MTRTAGKGFTGGVNSVMSDIPQTQQFPINGLYDRLTACHFGNKTASPGSPR